MTYTCHATSFRNVIMTNQDEMAGTSRKCEEVINAYKTVAQTPQGKETTRKNTYDVGGRGGKGCIKVDLE